MSDNIPPQRFDWTDEGVMRPKVPRLADKHFVVGMEYMLVPHEDRSMRSHRFYFASVNEAWKNLPEDMAERYPTADHLRKWALIKAGYRDERSIVAFSKAEALRIAAFIRPMDEYAVVVVREAVVRVYTAKSQSTRAMGKAEFGTSKEKVLDILSAMIGTTAATLAANAEATE